LTAGCGRRAVFELEWLEEVVERVNLVVAHATPSRVFAEPATAESGSQVPTWMAIVPRIMEIAALREVEPWTGPSLVLGTILLIATLAVIVWAIRRYLDG
jgi:hypothetical protein